MTTNSYCLRRFTSTDGPAVYDQILCPSFAYDELGSRTDFCAGGQQGIWQGLIAVEDASPGDQEKLMGALLWESRRVPEPTVLLAWLAVLPNSRDLGLGGALLDRCLALLRGTQPALVLAEVEDPRQHPSDIEHGDPGRRLQFYARRGARALDLPYVQPPVGGGSPVENMLLIAFPIGLADSDRSSVPGDVILRYLGAALGKEAATPWGGRLLSAAAVPAVRLVALSEWLAQQ